MIAFGADHVAPPSVDRVSQRSPYNVDASSRSNATTRAPSSLDVITDA
jgi:hypothetical protein